MMSEEKQVGVFELPDEHDFKGTFPADINRVGEMMVPEIKQGISAVFIWLKIFNLLKNIFTSYL